VNVRHVLPFIVLACGCSSGISTVLRRDLPAEEVLRIVRDRDRQVRTLRGEGSISFESPGESNSGSFEVYVKKPDSLRLELKGPFGIHVGTLTISGTAYLFYNWRDNTATRGTTEGTPFAFLIQIALRANEVIRSFSGEFLPPLSGDSLVSFSVRDDMYTFQYRSGDGIREYRVDPAAMRASSYRFIDGTDKTRLLAMASRFDDDYIVPMPRLLRVVDPVQRRSVTISYGDISLNEPVVCSFTLPQRADSLFR
jgi:outer membrane lipoprotein-sorting protein